MGTPHTVTYAEVDRLFSERLRLIAVANGFLPDRTAYNSETAYKAARDAIATGKNQSIEVFGEAPPSSRDDKIVSRMVVRRVGEDQGSIGLSGLKHSEPVFTDGVITSYQKYDLPDTSTDLIYEIRVISNKTEYERIMSGMVRKAIRQMSWLPTIKDDGSEGEKVMVKALGMTDLSMGDYTEKMYRYRVEDVYIDSEFEEAPTNVPLLKEVKIIMKNQDIVFEIEVQ